MKTNPPSEQEIAHRAREIWANRGEPAGQDTQIWLEAERQLTTEATATAPTPTERLRGEMASESEVEFQITPAIPDDEAIKAALQKRGARAPKLPHANAPHAKPPETGKPLWSKPHSS